MNPSLSRTLHRVANVGIVLALLLATLPFGMKAYGHLSQKVARMRYAPAPAAARPAKADGKQRIAKTPPRKKWETSVIQIPAIGVDAVVTEGAGQWELVIGPGHLPGSAGAGGAGNCVIGAHRNLWDSTFADLPKLKPGDEVHILTPEGRSTYRIEWNKEIRTSYKKPLRNTRDARITLVTCVLPFDARRRWVAQGVLVDNG